MGKLIGWRLAAAFLSAALGGCVTRSSTTEGDREVEDQTEKAGIEVQQRIAAAQAKLDEGKMQEAKSILEIGARAGVEIEKNMAQLRKVHGPPEQPKPFTAENSAAARKKSDDDHAGGKWIIPVVGVLASILSVAATLAGMPFLAPIFPALAGKVGTWAKTGTAIINDVRAEAEANGGSIDVGTVLKIAKSKNVQAGIDDLVRIHAHAHEDAMGHNLTSLEEIKTADADPSPAAAEPVAPAAAATP